MGILIQGFVLGLVGGIVPGAVLSILFVSAMQGGLRAGLYAFWWAMFAEVVIAGGLLLVFAQFSLPPAIFNVIGLCGGVALLYFGRQVYQLREVAVEVSRPMFTGTKIFFLSATNAPLYIFWTTVCFPLIWQLAVSWGLMSAAVSYFVLFEIGWGISTFAMLLLFLFSRSTLTDQRIMHRVFIVVALILGFFGVRMFITSALALL